MTPSSTSGSEDFIKIPTFKYFHQQKHRTYICNYKLYIISLHTLLVCVYIESTCDEDMYPHPDIASWYIARDNSSCVSKLFVRFNITEVTLSMADCLMKKSQKKTYFNICLKAYLNLYLLQKTIFGNVALSTGVVFEISVVDTVASWYVLSVLKKIGMVMLF